MAKTVPHSELADALRRGIALFQQGRHAEAEALVAQAQASHPRDFNAMHMLGVLLAQGSDPARGVTLIARALELRADFAPAWNNLGNGYQRLGRSADAQAAYERAIVLQPAFVEAYNNRGNTLMRLGRPRDALADFETAVRIDPAMAEAHGNRAVALLRLGQAGPALEAADTALALRPDLAEAHVSRAEAQLGLDDAMRALDSAEHALRLNPRLAPAHIVRANALLSQARAADALDGYDQAIVLAPGLAAAHNNRGNALAALGRGAEALESFDTAIRLQPDFAEAFNNRGKVAGALLGPDAALQSYDRAIALAPGYAAAHSNRGNILLLLGQTEAALGDHDIAVASEPGNFRAHNNRGNTLLDLKRVDAALQSYDRAVALRPGYAEAHWNRGFALLLQGRMAEGWPEYDFRHRCAGFGGRDADRLWTGAQDLAGKTLLIRREQGMGDMIQFCRYALVARAMGARVLLAPHKGLEQLMAGLGPDIAIVREDASGFDYQIPLLDMPAACGTRLDTIPWPGPYLAADPARAARWRETLGEGGLKVGICWQGNPDTSSDIGRSFPVRLFEDIARIPDLRLIALQKGYGLEQLRDLPADMRVERPAAPFDDGPDAFLDTAAVMANLDLVITSDTAVAHLAGAMGRAVIVALKYAPDWRWLLGRGDSPWYPQMQLVRQPGHGDWGGVFAQIETRLRSRLR